MREKSESIQFKLSSDKSLPSVMQDPQGGYALVFDGTAMRVQVELNAAQARTLGLLCLQHFPDIEPRYAISGEDEAYRLPARRIAFFDDRALQVLLRELCSEDLIVFLWYMKDAELAKRMLRNMSHRAAQMLLADLAAFSARGNPDKVPLSMLIPARQAVLRVLDVVDRLQQEGQILSS
jgi:hypothetical protein